MGLYSAQDNTCLYSPVRTNMDSRNEDKSSNWLEGGLYAPAQIIKSPNHNPRPPHSCISLVVLHNISLPPNEFGGPGVIALFTNNLDPADHPYYATISHLEVSSHFFIRRDGTLIQFVSCDQRAWHAGESSWEGQSGCNDFSIGIELEGADTQPFEECQYSQLVDVLKDLMTKYPIQSIVGHEHIAPQRKTDPGPHFDWNHLKRQLPKCKFP